MRVSASLAGAAALALAAPAQAEWVASWTAAPHAPLGTEGPFAAASYDNVTISQILRVSEGGKRLRVKFSNRYGPAPLEIGAARIVQLDANNQELAGTSRVLTFGGAGGAAVQLATHSACAGAASASAAAPVSAPAMRVLLMKYILAPP